MNKINPEYLTINQLLTDARAYAKLRDDVDDPFDESLKNRPNYHNLEIKLKEVEKLYSKVGKNLPDPIKKQIKEIRDLYWGIEKEVYSDGTSCITVNLGKMHPKKMKDYVEICSRFRKQVSKRVKEFEKSQAIAREKNKGIIITY